MTIRQIPAQETRVESGPIQFGDDWPGVFIRGDNAMYYALELGLALDDLGDKMTGMTRHVLEGLRSDLARCERKPFYTEEDLPGPLADHMPEDRPKFKVLDFKYPIRHEDLVPDNLERCVQLDRTYRQSDFFTPEELAAKPMPWWLLALIWLVAIGSWVGIGYLLFGGAK